MEYSSHIMFKVTDIHYHRHVGWKKLSFIMQIRQTNTSFIKMDSQTQILSCVLPETLHQVVLGELLLSLLGMLKAFP